MEQYADASGHLLELRDKESKAWFSYICDLAISSSTSTLSQEQLNALLDIFEGKNEYEATASTPTPQSASASPANGTNTIPQATNFLSQIGGFTNFKRLSSTLVVRQLYNVEHQYRTATNYWTQGLD